jgi:DNA-binding MarR family transcriptional regulator
MAGTSEQDDVERALAELPTVVAKLRRRLHEEARNDDLTPSQFAAFRRLIADGPTTLTELANAEGMRPQSMGAIVAALQAAGFVAGEPDPNDGRRTILTITDASRDLVRANRAAKNDWLFRTLDENFTEAERAHLSQSVELLRRLINL